MAGNIIKTIDNKQKNYLINGGFDFWQRGNGAFVSNEYTSDRWYLTQSGAPEVSREVSEIPEGSTYSMRLRVLDGSDAWNMQQALESAEVVRLHNKTVTFSVKMKKDVSFTPNVNLIIEKNSTGDTQTGGAWSTVASVTIQNADISSSDFSTFSITGTVGTEAGLRVRIQQNGFGGGGTEDLYVAQAMLNEGSAPAPFQRAGRNIQEELQLCQRYYEKTTGGYGFYELPVASASQIQRQNIRYAVPKRVTPTNTISPAGGTATASLNGGNAEGIFLAFSGAQYNYAQFDWTADAEL